MKPQEASWAFVACRSSKYERLHYEAVNGFRGYPCDTRGLVNRKTIACSGQLSVVANSTRGAVLDRGGKA